LDRGTRGFISETIHWNFEHSKVLETVDWVLKADDQILSREDFALGYYMGSLMSMAVITMGNKKFDKKLIASLDSKAKRPRPIHVEVTSQEKEEIKDMLIPMIARFREKIRQEEALKKL
jgi:hypothetical protein